METHKERPNDAEMTWSVHGTVRYEDSLDPVANVLVNLYGSETRDLLGTDKTNVRGYYEICLADDRLDDCEFFLVVTDRAGHVLLSTDEFPTRAHGEVWEANLLLPEGIRLNGTGENKRPTIQVGPMLLDALEVERAKPDIVLDIVRALVDREISDKTRHRIAALSPELLPDTIERTLCGTPILETIEALIRLKQWPRELRLEIDDILSMRWTGFAEETYDCPNFRITYQTSGPAAVNLSTAAETVNDPGSNPPVSIGSLAAGSPPTYIKRVCFWLERALASYINPPFSMLNPAGGGKIQVYINTAPYGSASPSAFYLNNNLNNDLMCAVAVHELFHMVQYLYPGTGTWRYSIMEGGAVFAEDSAADLMNRYLDEAGSNFNGIGVLTNPNLAVSTAGYKASLFWRYIAEQHSPHINPADEPKIGVETYRKLIEICSAGSHSTADVKNALRQLPWYQDFYEFGYLDPARLDRTSSETTLGNYALACYLKELGANVPDRRFDFMEDEENIYIDEVIPGAPLQSSLAIVAMSGSGTVTPSVSPTFMGSVNNFAHRFYEVAVDTAVTNINIQFTAGGGFTSHLFQIVLIDEDNVVRDIHRTDTGSYTKRITNLRDGKRLARIALVVTGADSSGTFSISVSAAAAAPDVMVTRWHSIMQTEYEIDSRNWAWTWVSPDIWVDNDNDGLADGQVYFNYNNQLHIRLHNKGNLAASGIQVQFFYQDASGGLADANWLPVKDMGGTTQVLSGLSLADGASNDWSVNWSPVPSGSSHHFCIRAIVTVAGDPNTDNKRVLSNFGNVVVKFGGLLDIDLIRRNILDVLGPIELRVIPRLTPDLEISMRDIQEQAIVTLKPGEAVRDVLRINHRPLKAIYDHDDHKQHDDCLPAERMEWKPDPRGYYRTDPRALPPGVGDKPMVTIVHEVDGLPLGGVSFMVEIDDSEQ